MIQRLVSEAISQRVPARAEKTAARGEPRRRRGQAAGPVSFGTFLCAKEKYINNKKFISNKKRHY